MTSLSRDGVVTFEFYRPGAAEVKVLGTFNGWRGDSLAMTASDEGWWRLEAELPAGEYRFRYWADGEWFTDFAANGVESGKHGWNSVLIISEQKQTMMRSATDNTSEADLATADWTPLRIGGDEQVSAAA